METLTNKAHQKLEIKPRQMDFAFGSLKNLKYFDDNIYKSSFIAGLSAAFPPGEGEFLDSVKLYRDQITNPDLNRQVKGFIGQEGHHSHQHKIVNKELDRLGFNTDKVDKLLHKMINSRVKKLSNKFRLAHTVCAEHITALMGEHIINQPDFLKNMEAPMKDLMFWHAVEEVEHKSVAYDVYMECVGDRAYLNKTMKFAILALHFRLTRYMFMMAFSTKHWWNLKDLASTLKWMFGKGGMWRSLRKPYKAFYSDDFHPWRDGGLELIEKWKNDYYHPIQDKSSDEYLRAKVA